MDILSKSFLNQELTVRQIENVAEYCVKALAASEFTLCLADEAGGLSASAAATSSVASATAATANTTTHLGDSEENAAHLEDYVGYTLGDACKVDDFSCCLLLVCGCVAVF